LADDGEYAAPRRKLCESEKHPNSKRNICEVAASHKRLFENGQSKSHV